jgi:hypothetical protein
MSSISSSPSSAWGALGAPDWRHAPASGSTGNGPARAGSAAGAAGWFDPPGGPSATGGAASLTADVSPEARGLSAPQHAARVLSLLLG